MADFEGRQPEVTHGHSAAAPSGFVSRKYELTVLFLLGISFGFAFFDRMAMTFLSPYVIKDLSLNNTEVGALGAGLSATWALGAYIVGTWSDAIGRRKPFLLAGLVVFSFCSVLSGLSWSFGTLFATRMVMGAAEGPFLPICLAIMAAASAESRRGLNAGIVQNAFGSILGTAMAPILLVWIAEHYGWREAFFISGIPGLILAVLVWRFVAEPAKPERHPLVPHDAGRGSLSPWAMLRERNVALCAIISCFGVGSLLIGTIFMPLYLNGPRGFAPETWSWMMAIVGICPAIGGVFVPALSDWMGRKPPMVIFGLLLAVPPLTLLYVDASVPVLTVMLFVGQLGAGIFPLFMGVIPAETLGRARAGTAMGLVVAAGELTGGVFGPIGAGHLADQFGLAVPMMIQAALAIVAGLISLGLKETNPLVLARRAAKA